MTGNDPADLMRRYVAVWNEPDLERRRAAVQQLWAEDAAHLLEPPQDIRSAAATLGFASARLEARGHKAIEARVARSYEEFVAPGSFRFRARDNAGRLGDVVKFNWEMVHTSDGDVAGVGLEILVLGKEDRIQTDHQFIEG